MNLPTSCLNNHVTSRKPLLRLVIPPLIALVTTLWCGSVRASGLVAAWGLNDFGETVLPQGVRDIQAISANYHSLALRTDGTVVAWGANWAGQASVPADLSHVKAVSAGGSHSLALLADGTVVAWGDNQWGQTTIPAGLSNVVAISAGGGHNLALRADGTLMAWGYNLYGETNIPSGLTGVSAISAGPDYNLVLKSDGTVLAWGDDRGGTNIPPGLDDIVDISAGHNHALGLRADGTVIAWGENTFGQTNVPAGLADVIAISAGIYTSMALTADGSVVIWGGNDSVPADVPPGLNKVEAIAAGYGHYLAILPEGPVQVLEPPVAFLDGTNLTLTVGVAATGAAPLTYQWFLNGVALTNDARITGTDSPQLIINPVQASDSGGYAVIVSNQLGSVRSMEVSVPVRRPVITRMPADQVVASGGDVVIAPFISGTMPMSYQWRLDGVDIPGATNSVLQLKAMQVWQSGYYNVVVRNPFGETVGPKVLIRVQEVFVWGAGYYSPILPTNVPPTATNLISVAAGGRHVLGLKSDGTVVAWGSNAVDVVSVPGGLNGVVAVAAGYYHNLALLSNGTVLSWGNGGLARLLTNTPPDLNDVVAISAGGDRYSGGSLALRSDGRVIAWGTATLQITNIPPTATNVVGIAGGGNRNLALRADGTVIAWGLPNPSVTNVPAHITNLIAIASGASSTHALGLRADGKVVAWGSNQFGQTNVPTGLSNVVAISAGYSHSLALKADGKVVSWGRQTESAPLPSGLTNAFAVAAGGSDSLPGFSVALAGDGSPALTLQPLNRTVPRGMTVQFHARAAGLQPMTYQWQFDGLNIPGATNASLTLIKAQASDQGDYRVIVSNSAGSATSATATLKLLYPGTLAEALNATNITWESLGTNAWFPQMQVCHDGDGAAQSGAIRDGQTSRLRATLYGPGTLTFWWRVSSEEGFDRLSFFRSQSSYPSYPTASISGATEWEQVSWRIFPGQQSLFWVYSKDFTVSAGDDAGWLDEVSFVPDPPMLAAQPVDLVGEMGQEGALSVIPTGAPPFSYQWFRDGAEVAGATDAILRFGKLTRRDGGVYAVRVSNGGGGTLSSNAVVTVRVPQLLSEPTVSPGGAFVFKSADADGGPLIAEDLPAFEVQVSTNFVDWQALPDPPTLTNGVLFAADPDSAAYSNRFYRVIEHK